MKKIAILPTLLTLGNAVCGFAAVAYASKVGQARSTPEANGYYLALGGWLVLGAMAFDALDGYVARLAKTASEFGGQLDSLCDAVSFGLAPAFLLLKLGWDSPHWHQALSVIAALYMVCALLRLARFNVENSPDPASHKRFRGLPSPGAAGCLASLAILSNEPAHRLLSLDPTGLQPVIAMWASLGAVLVALLMVSRLPYPHMTKQVLRRRRPFKYLVQVVLVGFAITFIPGLSLVLLFWIYALVFPARYLVQRSLHLPTVPAPATGIEDARHR